MKQNGPLHRLISPFSNSGISAFAAASCFYMALSIVPSVEILIFLIGRYPWISKNISAALKNIIPAAFTPIISTIAETIHSNHSALTLSFSGLLTMWSASKSLHSVIDGLNQIFSFPSNSYFYRRIMGMLCYFVLLILFVLLCSLQIVLAASLRLVVPQLVGTFILLVPCVSLVYWIPYTNVFRFRHCLLGGCCCVSAWIILFAAFSVYLSHLDSFSLSVFLLIGLWGNILVRIFFYGGILIRETAAASYHPIREIRKILRSIRK